MIALNLGNPWPKCIDRSPPTYNATVQDHADLSLQVNTGDALPDFTLSRANQTGVRVRLSDILQTKNVMLQFGAYT